MNIKGKNVSPHMHCNSAFSREFNHKMESFHEGKIPVTKASQQKTFE